jgi:hypothetical protein
MTKVYNYIRLGQSGGDAAIDDAPPAVIAAIEHWLNREQRPESESGVGWDVLPERRLSLLLLRHAISNADGHRLELVHVVAVPERRLTEVSEEAITGFFESLYGSPLSMALTKLLASLAGRPRAETAARVRDLFADDAHLEALQWQDFEGPARPAPEPPDATPRERRSPARIAAGLGALVGTALGVALAYSPLLETGLPGFAAGPAPLPQTQERLARLEQRVDRLVEQEQASRSALSDLTRSHAGAVMQLREELEALQRQPSPVAKQEEASPPAVPSIEETTPSASSTASGGRTFRVIARSARVRTGPSTKERTRGLLARGRRVVVTDEQDAWLEIEPPPGFGAPAWIHRTLVETVKPASEKSDIAPPAA